MLCNENETCTRDILKYFFSSCLHSRQTEKYNIHRGSLPRTYFVISKKKRSRSRLGFCFHAVSLFPWLLEITFSPHLTSQCFAWLSSSSLPWSALRDFNYITHLSERLLYFSCSNFQLIPFCCITCVLGHSLLASFFTFPFPFYTFSSPLIKKTWISSSGW